MHGSLGDHTGWAIPVSVLRESFTTLRARLVPSAPGRRPEFFTIGSTKDEVLRVQGSPRRFDDDRWEYGYSYVEFDENGRVVDWYDSGHRPLRVGR